MTRTLDLGAGDTHCEPGAVRADSSRAVRPDVVLDAESPLPFRESAFGRVLCFDLLEHVNDVPALMTELHRVLIQGGHLLITTPHFSCANSYTDPTHRHHFAWHAFDYFAESHTLSYYSTARYRVAGRILRFHGGIVDAAVRRIANRWPDFYEHRLAWIFPAWYLEVELEAIK